MRCPGVRVLRRLTFVLVLGGLTPPASSGQAITERLREQHLGSLVYFPPEIPVFGDRLTTPPASRRRPEIPAPEGLADFVGEIFYPPLGSRLFDGFTPRRLQTRLDDFRSVRSALLNELHEHLLPFQLASEEERTAALRAFAPRQEARILALETEAEALRRELIGGSLLDRTADWSRDRRWLLGKTRFPNEQVEREAEFQVIRAAAYYQDGLTIEQRGLLLELAYELRQRARDSRNAPATASADAAAMFFSPATARLRLPPDLPPDLRTLIGRFNREKTDLKEELQEAVLRLDTATPAERTREIRDLADRQWPRFAPLEALAEEIRLGLARIPTRPLKAPPHVPPALLARIQTYMEQRQQLLAAFQMTARAANELTTFPPPDPSLSPEERAALARQQSDERAAVRSRVFAEFERQTRARTLALRADYDQIQLELQLVAAAQFDPETGRPLTPDTLLQNYSSAMERFDTLGREEVIYQGYRQAMLTPGFSPAQRRLLFAAALLALAQALPPAENLPSGSNVLPRS